MCYSLSVPLARVGSAWHYARCSVFKVQAVLLVGASTALTATFIIYHSRQGRCNNQFLPLASRTACTATDAYRSIATAKANLSHLPRIRQPLSAEIVGHSHSNDGSNQARTVGARLFRQLWSVFRIHQAAGAVVRAIVVGFSYPSGGWGGCSGKCGRYFRLLRK